MSSKFKANDRSMYCAYRGDLPQYLTKHVPTRFFEDTKQGRLRAGTTYSYRGGEDQIMRLSDRSEGGIAHNVQVSGTFSGTIGGAKFTDVSTENVGTFYRKQINYSSHALCFSEGSYVRGRHLSLVEGFGDYKGDQDLSCFVVFDMKKLLSGLVSWARSGGWLKLFENPSQKILMGSVAYGSKDKSISLGSGGVYDPIPTASDYLDANFIKPKLFRVEEEYRIVLRTRFPESITLETPALFTSGALIAGAVVSSGVLK